MMVPHHHQKSAVSRRTFLIRTGLGLGGFSLGTAALMPLFAEPKIASRIEKVPEQHPLVPALRMTAQSMKKVETIQDYEAILIKNELVDSEMIAGRMQLKFREKPKGVYLKFLAPHAGREVIYWPDKNKGKMLVHDVGLASLVGTVSLDPAGSLAMEESRYPISQIGLKRMLQLLMDQWLQETKLRDVSVNFYPNAKIGKTSCRVIEVVHDKQHDLVRFHTTRLYLERKSGLPIRIQNFDFPKKPDGKPVLVEDYYYSDLRTNVGLRDIDFDTRNPKYNF